MANGEKRPLVSVIMPAYRASAYIAEAVRSVMAQTYPNWELLVIDDGSDDDTCAIVEGLAAADRRIRLLRTPENLGAAGSRNRGLDCAAGEYIAFLDSDDLWLPDKLQVQLERMESTGAGLCCCSYSIMDSAGNPAKKDYIVPETVTFEGLLRENVIGCSTVVLRRGALGERRFRPDYFHEDYALWLQMLNEGIRAVGCARVLARWRYIPTSRSFDKRNAACSRWRIYRRYLGLPLLRSLGLFTAYALAGIKKYGGR